MRKTKVVVIGGGTGTFTVLQGLKHYTDLHLSAIVTMTDSGGSTGRLRDDFGMLPIGDVRMCLVALAREDEAGKLLRELFLYRFANENSALSGHNFGNIFLTALVDILGSEEKAISATSEILNVRGEVVPVTTDNVNLMAEYANGDILQGEKNIDEPDPKQHDCTSPVKKMWTEPGAKINPRAQEVIAAADFIVLGPGDLYSSLLSNMVVKGMPEALAESKAELIYITNLVSKYGQTHGLKLSDYVAEVTRYSNRRPDYLLINNASLPDEVMERYKSEKSFPIDNDLDLIKTTYPDMEFILANMISKFVHQTKDSDAVKRSLLRHDSIKLANILHDLFNAAKG